jgi:hypothetical protein
VTVPDGIRIHPADARELIETLQFLDDWLSRDEDQLHESLERFVGHSAYGVSQLRHDTYCVNLMPRFAWPIVRRGLRRRRAGRGRKGLR